VLSGRNLLAVAALAFSLPAGAQTYVSTDVPKTISSGTPSTISSILSVPDAFIIDSLTVQLTAPHGASGDMDIFLIGPGGFSVELSTDNGAGRDGFVNAVFDDAAAASITSVSTNVQTAISGSFRPEQPLASFHNTSAMGQWTLRIMDDTTFIGGSLQAWSLTFVAAVIPEPQSYALLLAGLGLLGFAARRKLRA
jgi:subtilisin-like proprotein convertase family protein